MVVTLAGCPGRGASGLSVEICSKIGVIDRLTVTVLGAHGALITDRPVPESGDPPQLPGRLRIEGETADPPLTVLVTGWRAEQPVGFAGGELKPPTDSAVLCLTDFPPDRDGDLIPDDLDGCPDVPDPDQQDADGDGVTDICAFLSSDAGVPADAGPTDAIPADRGALPGVDRVVWPADTLPPPPPDLGPCPVGAACDDGDPCTTGDSCGADTICRGTTAPNGTQCGPLPDRRCCGGQCVNIAADTNHCGGCGLACAPGRICQGVAQTTLCSVRPKETSGRCICGSDAQCPRGQECRTLEPESNRCSPKEKSHCATGQSVRWVDDCPNFCFY